jgi:hypothetical protein
VVAVVEAVAELVGDGYHTRRLSGGLTLPMIAPAYQHVGRVPRLHHLSNLIIKTKAWNPLLHVDQMQT